MYSYRVYKKLVRKLIHYGNKKIFFYRVCFSKRTKNSRGEIQIEIFVRTFYTPCITIKIFLITVMYQFSYELFIHPVFRSQFSFASKKIKVPEFAPDDLLSRKRSSISSDGIVQGGQLSACHDAAADSGTDGENDSGTACLHLAIAMFCSILLG